MIKTNMIKKGATFFLLSSALAVITAWAAGGVSVVAQVAATVRPDLTGQWQLNRDLSDDAREKLQSMAGRHGGGGGEQAARAQLEEVILSAPAKFVLTQDDQKVVLTEPDGRVRTLPTHNRKVKVDGRDVQTKWEKNRLVSEIAVGNAKVIETYERSPNAQQLIVTTRVSMKRHMMIGRQVSVRRVYDAVMKQEPPEQEQTEKRTDAPTQPTSAKGQATDSTMASKTLPSINQKTPLSAGQKIEYGARVAFLNPGAYIGPAFGAYFTERNELRVPAKTREDYIADGLSFYARSFAKLSTARFLASGVYPALFHQDPRYLPSFEPRFGARVLYAVSRTALTRSDSGRTQFNYSKLSGFLTSATLANAYERNTAKARDAQGRVISLNQRTGTAATFRNFGSLVAGDVVSNVFFNEFRLGEKMGRALKKLFGK